jgi:hypothetical protein
MMWERFRPYIRPQVTMMRDHSIYTMRKQCVGSNLLWGSSCHIVLDVPHNVRDGTRLASDGVQRGPIPHQPMRQQSISCRASRIRGWIYCSCTSVVDPQTQKQCLDMRRGKVPAKHLLPALGGREFGGI